MWVTGGGGRRRVLVNRRQSFRIKYDLSMGRVEKIPQEASDYRREKKRLNFAKPKINRTRRKRIRRKKKDPTQCTRPLPPPALRTPSTGSTFVKVKYKLFSQAGESPLSWSKGGTWGGMFCVGPDAGE
ncbi:hypothetical protein GWI33_008143 [Rhynchophorus ferrugineus]|uniref:Uncharacterized protein n=1 Tax=Rhynchophorus ferrugineus TaxID=354439 RepID=A0A834MCE7_RHYFE|nr:hypothetical protein GWI33_008143 [Rhynchophorus ferrugineus]